MAPFAATLPAQTDHLGTVTPVGPRNVFIAKQPVALAMDVHACPVPPLAGGPHPPTPFPVGSVTVLINGRSALRTGDRCGCGAGIVTGIPNVIIGG